MTGYGENGPLEGETMTKPAARTLALTSLTVVAALGLSACTVTPGEDPTDSPTTAATSGSQGTSPGGEGEGSGSPSGTETAPSDAPPMSLDRLSDALLEGSDFPVGGAVSRQDQRVQSAPFTMYLNLNGFTPEGECAQLLEQVNSFEAPQSSAVAASYETDLEPADGGDTPPTVQFMAVATQRPVDAMSVYSRVPQACGTLEGDEAPGATATFEPVEVDGAEVDAVQLRIEGPDGDAQTLVVGGISEGRNHLYAVMSLVEPEDAQEILAAQAERFRSALEDQGA